jgi:tubulin epsilon
VRLRSVDDVVIAPYNSCFALRELTEHADCVFPVDNAALSAAVDESLGTAGKHAASTGGSGSTDTQYSVAVPTSSKLPFDKMNAITAQMLSNLTCSMRFPGQLNMDLNEITTNLVPYPRLHYICTSLAPLHVSKQQLESSRHLDAMFSQALERGHQLLSCPAKGSRFLATAFVTRGPDVSISDVTRNVSRMKEKMDMVYWNKDGFKTTLCSVPPVGHKHSLLMLANNCSVAVPFADMRDKFKTLYSVKSHVHHYTEYLEMSYFDDTLEILGSMLDDYSYLGKLQPPASAKTKSQSLRELLVL